MEPVTSFVMLMTIQVRSIMALMLKVILQMMTLEDGRRYLHVLQIFAKYQFSKFPAETFPFTIVDNGKEQVTSFRQKSRKITFVDMLTSSSSADLLI